MTLPPSARALAASFLVALMPLGAFAQGMPPGGGMPGMASGPTEVGVMALAAEDVPYELTLPGRAVATEQTEIRPRVSGMIEDITYTAGATVKAGDVLFRLEDDSYRAAFASAEAAKASAEAAVSAAQATVDRYTKLEGTSVAVADLQTAQTTLAQAQASLMSAEASLQSAQLDLDRVEITSPIDGVVDVPTVSVGALVTANQSDALTTVTQLDRIYVDVAESAARIARVRERMQSGALEPGANLAATLTLESGTVADITGTLVTPGLSVSTSTGAVDMRFEFPNPGREVLPGQFLRVNVTIGTQNAILVPQRATTRQSDGTLTAFIAADGTAQQVTLTYSGTYRNAWVVTDGVAEGDEIILDGLSSLTDGAEITTVPVTINDAGVVEDAATPAAE